MKKGNLIIRMSRINVVMMALFGTCIVVALIYGDDPFPTLIGFGIPFLIALMLYVPYLASSRVQGRFPRKTRYKMTMVLFLYIVLIGSLPFILGAGMNLIDGLFESMAGFTTTGLTSVTPEEYFEVGHSFMFYRCAIQWVGGGFYLIVAFMIISDITDIGGRTMEMDLFSRLGLRLRLSTLLVNISIIYGIFTILAMISFRLGGLSIFDSMCLSLGTVSTGGLYSHGRSITGGVGIQMLVVLFMFLSGMGFYIHLSVLSARGRSRTFFSKENMIYLLVSAMVPIVAFMILFSSGLGLGGSVWRGIFASISALTTTGFMVSGMDGWPDSMSFLLVILMLIGGSTMSVASGFKIRRVYLLVTSFIADMKKSAHPRAVTPLSRGEKAVSTRALESANVYFFYMVMILAVTTLISLMFEGDIFPTISLCVTSLTNSGIAFGRFAEIEGIASLKPLMKTMLLSIMFLGRFEILLPLYLMSPRTFTFNG